MLPFYRSQHTRVGTMRFNVREVARVAGVHIDVVHRARRAGKLKAHAKGSRYWYFERPDIVAWLLVFKRRSYTRNRYSPPPSTSTPHPSPTVAQPEQHTSSKPSKHKR